VLGRLGFAPTRFPVYPVDQQVAEKLHALTLPRPFDNTRARDLVDLACYIAHFTFPSDSLAAACAAILDRRATHPWPTPVPEPTSIVWAALRRLAGLVGLASGRLPRPPLRP
jgi:hypothetical protein